MQMNSIRGLEICALVGKVLLVLCLAATPTVLLAQSPAPAPSEADVNRLLAASRAQTLIDGMRPQIDALQQQQFAQLAAQRDLSDAQKARLERIQQRSLETVHKAMAWSQLRPMYVQIYQRTFSRADVIAMAEFYESAAGQSLLDKTPALMQNLMAALQQQMLPLFSELERDVQQIVDEPAPAQ
jgi:hypothetical protein